MITTVKKVFEEKYSHCRRKITDISYDLDNRESLCKLEEECFDYDQIVKDNYGGHAPASPDIIHFRESEVLLIEFKNGDLNKSHVKKDLKLKGIEGGFLALHGIVSREVPKVTFEEISKIPKSYIVVYNGAKNDGEKGAASSRTAGIIRHLQSNEIRFGLERYNNTFFRKTATISNTVFEKQIKQLLDN